MAALCTPFLGVCPLARVESTRFVEARITDFQLSVNVVHFALQSSIVYVLLMDLDLIGPFFPAYGFLASLSFHLAVRTTKPREIVRVVFGD